MVLLRFIGLMNAAVWFGAAVFFYLGIGPATFSPEMRHVLTDPAYGKYSGILDQLYWERILGFQIWCAVIALVHQLAEWLYMGRRLQRLTLYLVFALLLLGLVDGFWLQPRLHRLHQIAYSYQLTSAGLESHVYPQEERARAVRSLELWQKVGRFGALGLSPSRFSLTINWFGLLALMYLTWRIANPGDVPRFVPSTKFRS